MRTSRKKINAEYADLAEKREDKKYYGFANKSANGFSIKSAASLLHCKPGNKLAVWEPISAACALLRFVLFPF